MTFRVNQFPSSHPNITSVEDLGFYDPPLDAVLPHNRTWMLYSSTAFVPALLPLPLSTSPTPPPTISNVFGGSVSMQAYLILVVGKALYPHPPLAIAKPLCSFIRWAGTIHPV
jgi:hypothetical protein